MNNSVKSFLLSPMNMLYKINPELAIKILFYFKNGYKLNLKHPVTYNEKLNWMKLNYRSKLMPICADKYEVRKYLEQCNCSYLLNDLLWQGFDAKDIPFDDLPNQFVMKVTHGSSFNIICKNKNELSREEAVKRLNAWLKAKFILCYGEWFYGRVRPRIIIEKYLSGNNGEPPADYKVFCFHGRPAYIIVDTDRFTLHKRNVYDLEWNFKDGYNLDFPNDKPMKRPTCLEQLLIEAEKLSEPFPHARIDFYIVENRIIFSEITFTNGAGFDKISPNSFDVEMGNLLDLGVNCI